jgi:hypothetical protein
MTQTSKEKKVGKEDSNRSIGDIEIGRKTLPGKYADCSFNYSYPKHKAKVTIRLCLVKSFMLFIRELQVSVYDCGMQVV